MKYCPGVPTSAPSGLRTHICQVPITAANRKAPNATQKWARQSLLRTGNPPVGTRLELIVWNHLYRGPHLAVTNSTIFVARHEQIAGARKLGMHLRDKAWHYHGVDVRTGDEQSVDDIRRVENGASLVGSLAMAMHCGTNMNLGSHRADGDAAVASDRRP